MSYNGEDTSKISIPKSTISIVKTYQNVFLSKENTDMITSIVSKWNRNKLGLLKKGVPNKLGFMFTGHPGCGKSSLVYAIATETKKPIKAINTREYNNKTFLSLFANIENSVVVFDDIDICKFLHKRISGNSDDIVDYGSATSVRPIKQTKPNKSNKLIGPTLPNCKELELSSDNLEKCDEEIDKSMTMDAFLEVLDGYNYLNNCIVILTANHPELLDPAVYRPGRINHIIEFGLCNEYQFNNIFTYFTEAKYKEIDPTFIFTEDKHSTSFLINTIILPNQDDPKRILTELQLLG